MSGPEHHRCGNCEGIDPMTCINYQESLLPAPVPASPEGPDEGLREQVARTIYESDYRHVSQGVSWEDTGNKRWYYRNADAVLPLLTAERERVEAWIAEWYGCTSIADATRKGHQDDHECGGCSLRAALSATDPGSTQ